MALYSESSFGSNLQFGNPSVFVFETSDAMDALRGDMGKNCMVGLDWWLEIVNAVMGGLRKTNNREIVSLIFILMLDSNEL